MTARKKAPAGAAIAESHSACGVFAALGIVGVGRIEPVLLGALISGDPLLLIGPHGTGKSYLLERTAAALGLEWRHYNAALLNFDDLVGYPLPGANGSLTYVQTPSSIWGAEAVFIDEISRCRPDIQNKLFPVIHERRVQGLLLERLRYRWSAMNPPSSDDDDDGPTYLGSEPLDLALADRFAFVAEMPDWPALTEREREALICGSGAEIDPRAASRLSGVVRRGQVYFEGTLRERAEGLAAYIRIVVDLLRSAGILLSGRRAALLLRNIAAVHAARLALDPGAEFGDSAYLALKHSIPQPASGVPVDALKVLASHKEAWRLGGLPADDALRQTLGEPDPVRRALLACSLQTLESTDVSVVVADALASVEPAARHALAAVLFETGAASRLVAPIAEQCGELYGGLCTLQAEPDCWSWEDRQLDRPRVWRAVELALSSHDAEAAEVHALTNLLTSLFNAAALATAEDIDRAVAAWDSVWETAKEFGAVGAGLRSAATLAHSTVLAGDAVDGANFSGRPRLLRASLPGVALDGVMTVHELAAWLGVEVPADRRDAERELMSLLDAHATTLSLPAACPAVNDARGFDIDELDDRFTIVTVLTKSSGHVYLRDKRPNLDRLLHGATVLLINPATWSPE